jgi:ABC-type Fe3+-hydroxamate transport system substrate-binding protein
VQIAFAMLQNGLMRFAKWLFPFLLLTAAVGCKPKTVTVYGQNNPHQYHAAVSLSPSSTEIAGNYLGLTLEGRTASCNFPPNVRSLPIIMKGVKPDYEKIAAMRPDVALYDSTLFNASDLAKFKELNIDTLATGGDTLDDFVVFLYKAGAACGSETQISDYVDSINKALNTANTNLRGKSVRVAIILPGSGSEHMIAGTDGFLGDIIKRIGAQLVGPKGKIFQTMNVETFLHDDPQVILVAGDPKPIVSDSRLQGVSAVKDRKLYGLIQDLVVREGGRVDLLVNDIGVALVKAK